MTPDSLCVDSTAKRILTFDAAAAFIAGVAVVCLHPWLAALYGLPWRLVLCMGFVNLAYACYSGSLALRARRNDRLSRFVVDLLVAGNLGWALVCVALVAMYWASLRPWGVALVLGEALFVGGLASVERSWVRPQAYVSGPATTCNAPATCASRDTNSDHGRP